MATLAPYKGKVNTRETVAHLGSDWYDTRGSKTPTGVAKYDPANYEKLQKAANPDYYGGRRGGDAHDYAQPAGNNGQPTAHPTTTRGGVTAQFSNGDPTPDYSLNLLGRSNYAMAPGAQHQANGGVHIAKAQATPSAKSKYSLFAYASY